MLSAFAQHGPADIRPVLYVLDGFQTAHPELVGSFETEVCPVNGVSRGRRVLAESTWLPQQLKAVDAVHHFGGRIPFRTTRPAAVTVHDLQPLDHPERFSATKAAYLSWALPRSMRRADVIVCVSDEVTARIRSDFPVNPTNVTTVYFGVKEVAEQPATPASPPVIIYPAATYPHKNHGVLIDAFNQVADEHPDVLLVLTGGAGRAESDVTAAVANSRHTDRIERTGRIPAAELRNRMASATVLAFPSSYEGFGLPALEANALGVPVVVGAGTPTAAGVNQPELAIEPTDVSAWATALSRMLSDPQRRHQSAEIGLTQARKYLWEHSAEQLEQAWRLLLAGP